MKPRTWLYQEERHRMGLVWGAPLLELEVLLQGTCLSGNPTGHQIRTVEDKHHLRGKWHRLLRLRLRIRIMGDTMVTRVKPQIIARLILTSNHHHRLRI
jgi:hypothetical protein